LTLERLELRDFRNYEALEVNPAPGVNVFFGANAQGKTNILEAVFLLARGSSHRADRDVEMVRWGAASFCVRGQFLIESRDVGVEVLFSEEKGKTLRINGLPRRSVAGLLPDAQVVMFVPDDLQMVKGPASMRRRFLDQEIAQVNPSYGYDLSRYQKVLSQRNSLLRTGSRPDDPSVLVWTEQLVEHGTQVYKKRLPALRRLGRVAREVHKSLTGDEELEVTYRPSVPITGQEDDQTVKDAFTQRLKERASLERDKGMTLVGPHRDDIVFSIASMDARLFASQGQQRSIVVSMKVSELEFVRQETGRFPILLLDDILSELDASRRQGLIHAVSKEVQVFLTCTDYAPFESDLPGQTRYYRVEGGTVEAIARG
jgi:DNA replication and repair protein RecF